MIPTIIFWTVISSMCVIILSMEYVYGNKQETSKRGILSDIVFWNTVTHDQYNNDIIMQNISRRASTETSREWHSGLEVAIHRGQWAILEAKWHKGQQTS